ncbi:hypothetical protein KCP76_20155 [Salmonella enterica subsp. enterica serovar Weltevreden]|nr:hypothetical protein KCP76_20155 [Salmonella enterica subsp. enterica serovar Weltevreden]
MLAGYTPVIFTRQLPVYGADPLIYARFRRPVSASLDRTIATPFLASPLPVMPMKNDDWRTELNAFWQAWANG